MKKAFKSDTRNLLDFVKTIIDSGAIGVEFSEFKNSKKKGKPSYNLKLLQAVLNRYGEFSTSKMKEMTFEEFSKEIGY